jgi:hypothetical protein
MVMSKSPVGSGRRGPAARALTMDQRDDARAEELNNLRLALATFALQLDIFEMRMGGGSLRIGIESEIPVPPRDSGCRLPKEK